MIDISLTDIPAGLIGIGMSSWYFEEGGDRSGPIGEEELLQFRQTGRIGDDTVVWTEGFEGWKPFREAFPDGAIPEGESWATCAVSGAVRPEREMLRYGEKFVLPEHKNELVQRLAEGSEPGRITGAGYDFVDATRRAKMAKAFLVATTASEVVLSILGFFTSDPNSEDFTSIDGIFGMGALLFLFLLITTAVFFCRWTGQVSRNAHALAGRPLKFTPGWAVGWYFIPIANLWKPYFAMREIRNISLGRDAEEKGDSVIVGWWSLWIIGNLIDNASFRTANAGLHELSVGIDAASSLLSLVLLFFVLKLVGETTKAQNERAPSRE